MSAGTSDAIVPSRDLGLLAPKFRDAVDKALAMCASQNLDAFVYETYRSQDTQEKYFARGRTVIPPTTTVTNAPTNLLSWHGYGLAVDVISRSREWDAPLEWFEQVAACFRANGCRWGGEWKMQDLPHFQWGLCKPTPSDRARELIVSGGMQSVWDAVGAL
jgi:D-alanyl-D-alanine carboxypeptidase-like protein